MIQLGQLSLFVMAQLASRLPFHSAHVPPHWTYQLNSFREWRGEEWKAGVVEGKKWNKECSNNHIIHFNVEANYRDKCDFCSAEDPRGGIGGCWSDAKHGDLIAKEHEQRHSEGQEMITDRWGRGTITSLTGLLMF